MSRRPPAIRRLAHRAFALTACALAGSGLGWPGSAQAQTAPAAPVEATDDVAAVLREFREKFGPLLEIARISPEVFDQRVAPLVRAAVPTPPPSGDWGFSMGFNVDTSVYDTPPEEGRLAVAGNAADCSSIYPEARPVLRHRAIRREGLTGHVCAFFGSEAGDAGAVLSTALYVESPDRHATLKFASAGTVDDDLQAAEQMMRGVIDANLALTDALGELVVDALVNQTRREGGNAGLIQETLETLAASLKAPTPVVDRAELDRRIAAAVPKRPEGDDRTWGSSVDFKVDYALGTSARRPDADGYRVLEDARACLPREREAAQIAHFRRWSRDGLSGHVCGVTILEDDVWMLAVTVFAEGEGRRLRTSYMGSLAIDGDPAASAQLGRERLEAQIALAEYASQKAIDVLIAAPMD